MSTIDRYESGFSSENCPICMDSLDEGELKGHSVKLIDQTLGGVRVTVTDDKPHVYHARCIDRWIRTSATCPSCREPLINVDDYNTDLKRGNALFNALRNENRDLALRILSYGPIDIRNLRIITPRMGDDIEILRILISQPGMNEEIIRQTFEEFTHEPEVVSLLAGRVNSPLLLSQSIQRLSGSSSADSAIAIREILNHIRPDQIDDDCLMLAYHVSILGGDPFFANMRTLAEHHAFPSNERLQNLLQYAREIRNENAVRLLEQALRR